MQRKTAPHMPGEWKQGLSERVINCCSTGRENIDWLVWRQSVGWVVGLSVGLGLESPQTALEL